MTAAGSFSGEEKVASKSEKNVQIGFANGLLRKSSY